MKNRKISMAFLSFIIVFLFGVGIGIIICNIFSLKILSDSFFIGVGIPLIITGISLSYKILYDMFYKRKTDQDNDILKMYIESLNSFWPGKNKNDMVIKGIAHILIRGDDEIVTNIVKSMVSANGVKKCENNIAFDILYSMRKKFVPHTKLKSKDLEF